MEKGVEKEKLETAKKMILLKMSNEVITQITGLSEEKIDELRKNHVNE